MLQDIYPHHFDNSFTVREPKEGDYVLIFGKNTVLVKETEDSISLPTYPNLFASIDTYLFKIDDKAYFGRFDSVSLDGFEMKSIRSVFNDKAKEIGFACATAYHITNWKRYHTYCGVCSTILEPSKTERALVCPSCKHTIYPDIHPAVNIAIRNGDKLLLAKNNKNGQTYYSLIAGFIEVGETAEDTVRREVMEEVGLKVKNISYYASQPWGTVGNLQIGFVCDLDGSSEIHMDERELCEAKWVKRSEIPSQAGNFSITGELIEAFRFGKI